MQRRRKVRIQLHKNREKPQREGDLTRQYRDAEESLESVPFEERVRAKGEVSRKRTVILDSQTETIAADHGVRGRVLVSSGLYCLVVTDDDQIQKCYTRRLLKSLATEARGVVTSGDWVWFRPAPAGEGLILSVEPRRSVLTRAYRGREQIIAANVEQVLIVASFAEPPVKPSLVDRYLISAEQGRLRSLICFNKSDLIPSDVAAPLVDLYRGLGYPVLLTSAACHEGIEALRGALEGRETVIVGQSGVGKSSLLNALEPSLRLRVAEVSQASRKGRHTTTRAQLLRLPGGGTVIDTAGIRQFEPFGIADGAIDGFFVEMPPLAAGCHFPGCSHTHEEGCMVKEGLAQGTINPNRYESYLKILLGEEAAR